MANINVEQMPKLGFGLMRLPKKGEDFDTEQICEMVDRFMDAGMKYFDTAFAYQGSEEQIKKALVERYPRDSYYLATKLFAAIAGSKEEAEKEFYTSLERTGAGYFDFYLLHNLGNERTKYYEDYDLWNFIKARKEEGLIKHYGFSFHDKADVLDQILQEHPDAEFVQLQINYADWEDPAIESGKCYEVARRHGKPIVIMEPVKGGTLASPPEKVAEVFKQADPEASLPSWCIRFAASLPGVLTVLSGMSSIEQMEDNLSVMKDFKPLTEQEQSVVTKAREVLSSMETIPCTSCEYCMSGCPQEIPIPAIFSVFNRYKVYQNYQSAKGSYDWETVVQGRTPASQCIGCGACEDVCPQHIAIRDLLIEAMETFELNPAG